MELVEVSDVFACCSPSSQRWEMVLVEVVVVSSASAYAVSSLHLDLVTRCLKRRFDLRGRVTRRGRVIKSGIE